MIIFPNNPVNGQKFSTNRKSWTYNSTLSAWNSDISNITPTLSTLTVTNSISAGGTLSANQLSITGDATAKAASRTALGLGTGDTPTFAGATFATGSIATSQPLALTQTWTNAAVTYTGLQVNVTDTASNAASLLMDLRVGGTRQLGVSKEGAIFWRTGNRNTSLVPLSNGQLEFRDNSTLMLRIGNPDILPHVAIGTNLTFGWTNDLSFSRDAANTLAQRNDVNPQESRIYGTYSSSGANYERFFVKTNTGGATQIGLSAAGTGQNRDLQFVTGGSTRMTVTSGGNVGIGTGAPISKLHIQGAMAGGVDGADTVGLRLTNTNGGTWRISSGAGGINNGTFTIFQVGQPQFTGERFVITSAGDIGIGITNPTAKLDILDTTSAVSSGLSGSALNIAQTWNTNLTPTALSVNVTDLSSNAASLLMDLRVSGVSKATINKNGQIRASGGGLLGGVNNQPALAFVGSGITGFDYDTIRSAVAFIRAGFILVGFDSIGLSLANNCFLSWSLGPDALGAKDLALGRDAANTLAQRNGLNPQESRIYSTYTDANNYQRGTLTWLSGGFVIGTQSSTTAGVSALSALVNPIILAPGYNQSLSATAPVIIQQTWNNSANTFTLLSANVTDTASNAASLLMDLRVGGASRLSVSKFGEVIAGNLIRSSTGGDFGLLSIGGDIFLRRDAANTLAQRNGTAQQESRIYGTYTGAGNYRRLALKMDTAGVAQIVAEGGGAGAADNRLEFVTGGATRVTVAANGGLIASGSITGSGSAGGSFVASMSPSGYFQVSRNTDLNFSTYAGQFLLSPNSGSFIGWAATSSGNSVNTCFTKASSGVVKLGIAANSSDGTLELRNLTASGTVQTGGYTFANLPSPATQGMRAYITDGAASPVYMANAAGGSNVVTPVFYNGTNWINA